VNTKASFQAEHVNQTTNNIHACALEISNTGILIIGDSGSGKTSLCLGLLERAAINNTKASFVCDDQVLLETKNDSLLANAPLAINEQVEVRGYGITSLTNKPSTKVTLVVELVQDHAIKRMPDSTLINIQGFELPHLSVPTRHENQSVRIVFAWLHDNTDLKFF
jgi:serine kinase of HPr protein (carbohydrate metabolism regulator)